jgi:hypothetical protein
LLDASLHATVVAAGCALQALSLGVRVRAYGAGTVHSIFERAANLELTGGRLVALLDATCPNVPHGIRVDPNAWCELRARLKIGAAVQLEPDGVQFAASGLRLDWSAAHLWQLDLAGLHVECCHGRILDAVAHKVCARGHDPVAAAYSRRLARVQPPLERAIRQLRADTAIEQLHRLLGLGCGLTPAGDDSS